MIVRGEGNRSANLIIFGEGPGVNETRTGRPFIGAAGDFLNKALELASIKREDVWVDNIVKSRCTDKFGKDRPPTPDEINLWAPEVEEILKEIKPQIVVALGTTAVRYFLPELDEVGGLETIHGTCRKIEGREFYLYPAYHPAAGLHNPRLLVSFFWDFFKLRENVEEAEKGEVLEQWAGVDTEGTIEDPFCITASTPEWEQIGYHVDPPFHSREIRRLERPVLHNSLHDLQVLKKMGYTFPAFHDTMVMAYLLGFGSYDLNESDSGGGGGVKGLKELSYRYFSERWGSYPELIAQVRKSVEETTEIERREKLGEYLVRALQDETLPLKNAQRTKLAEYVFKGIWPKSKLRGIVEEKYGPVPEVPDPAPPTIRDILSDKLQDYAIKDAKMTGRLAPVLWKQIQKLQLEEVYQMDLDTIPMIAKMEERGILLDMDRVQKAKYQLQEDEERLRGELEEMVPGLEPSKAESIRRAFNEVGLDVKQRTKTGKVSTAKVVLDTHKAHPLVAKLAEWREVFKLTTTYIPALERFRNPKTGRIHPHYRITNTATGRLSAHSPNLMAFPTRTERGRMLRSCMVASEGYEILSADLDQIEMRVLADEAGDERMIRVIHEGLDLHTYIASLLFSVPYDQVDKKKQRQPAKSLDFLVVYEGGAQKLKEQMDTLGIKESVEYWQDFIDRWYGFYPGVERYQHQAHTEATTYGYVRDRWGRIRWALGVHAPRKDLRLKAEREASNFKIQSGAQGLLKRAMARIDRECGGFGAHPLLQIHDELIFEVPEGRGEEFEAYVAFEMAADEPLFKVPISASGKRGPDLGAVKD